VTKVFGRTRTRRANGAGSRSVTVAISSLLGDFYLGSSTLTVQGHSVPEPGTLALFGAALLGFGLIRRKRVSG